MRGLCEGGLTPNMINDATSQCVLECIHLLHLCSYGLVHYPSLDNIMDGSKSITVFAFLALQYHLISMYTDLNTEVWIEIY